MADGFLGRWSRRKQAVSQGEVPPEPAAAPSPPPAPPMPAAAEAPAALTEPAAEPQAPPPTMADVDTLTRQSDYRQFVGQNVAPEVRNAAMKKLFTDPHFNKIDWLDVYMDDYSIPSPLPKAVLRQMASAKFMNLVEDDSPPSQAAANPPHSPQAAVAAEPAAQAVAQSTPAPESPSAQTAAGSGKEQAAASATSEENHDDTDLRLQQDHAAGPQGPGGGAG